jgi:hypothetical protein
MTLVVLCIGLGIVAGCSLVMVGVLFHISLTPTRIYLKRNDNS